MAERDPHRVLDDRALLEGLGRIVRDGTAHDPEARPSPIEEDRFVERLALESGRSRMGFDLRPVWALAATLVVGLAVALVVWWPRTLGVTLEGAPLSAGSYVRADGPDAAHIHFSDGSEVKVASGSAARVEQITADGARLRLEDGSLEVSVVHSGSAAWWVDAGPFVIAVTGTKFEAVWSTSAQELRVTLEEGSVSVRGPLAPEGLTVQAGQVLTANLRTEEFVVTRRGSSVSAAAPPASSEAALPALPSPASSVPEASSALAVGPAPPSTPWSKLVAQGEFEAVLREADARGVDGVLSGGPLDDIVALSDAARYGGRSDLSRRCLLAVRKRFAGSGPATNAAFLLGRMAHDGGSPAGAIEWYDRYLAEAPSGTFASEALGRKMIAVRSTRGTEAARPLAEAYLARFPKGGFAAVAKEISGAQP